MRTFPRVPPEAAVGRRRGSLGLYFFSALGADGADGAYDVLLEAVRIADKGGLDFVWLPERHFTGFGGCHPNPSVVAAAVAAITSTVRIRAGSVVLPLHHPIRVAEEWAIVDNLSGGRVEISSATGWNPADFVMAPQDYENRAKKARDNLSTVRSLWRGDTMEFPGPNDSIHRVRTYPRPVQTELPYWVTASGRPETFHHAGEIGAGVLTGYGLFTGTQLEERMALYRDSHERHQGGGGRVAVMVHTAIGDSDTIRIQAEKPLHEYLRAYMGQQPTDTAPAVIEQSLRLSTQRYLRRDALIGDRDEVASGADRMFARGIDEIACLVDFGMPRDSVLRTVEEIVSIHRKNQSRTDREI